MRLFHLTQTKGVRWFLDSNQLLVHLTVLLPIYQEQIYLFPPTVITSSGAGTSTARETDGSLVDNTNATLDGFLEEGCSEDEDLEEEQLDFSCSEEEYEASPPPSSLAPVSPEPPSSPTPVVTEPPASSKGATFIPSSSVKAGNPHVPTPANGKWRDLFSSKRNISSCPKLMHFSALHDT
jgi:hypothetical protein